MIQEYISSFSEILNNTIITDASGNELEHSDAINSMNDRLLQIKKDIGTVFLVGNGGSSGIVSHSSIDLINMCKMRAHAITDNSVLTCMANDYGYENVFRQPLINMGVNGKDGLIAVSSSGKSPNIINAANTTKENGGFVITLSGFKEDNPLRSCGDYNYWLNADNYGKVEIGHALLLHILTDELCKRV